MIATRRCVFRSVRTSKSNEFVINAPIQITILNLGKIEERKTGKRTSRERHRERQREREIERERGRNKDSKKDRNKSKK